MTVAATLDYRNAPVIRDAMPEDQEALRIIYNHEIATGTSSFSTRERSPEDQRRWFEEKRNAGWPVLIGELDGTAVGMATFGPFRSWPGYRHSVEHSIYVAATHRRRGFGAALLVALIERARSAGHHAMVGAIDGGNLPSISLHQQLGFEICGRLPQVGRKFDRWLDLVFMVRLLEDVAT